MQMTDDEFFEIRVFLIGDLAVGKRSITQRFKKLNTTKTSEDRYFIQKDPRDAYGIGKKKNKKLQDQYNALSDMDKFTIRKEFERIDLMTFSKQISINKYHITLNFFPISEAEKIDNFNQDQAKEEDEDYKFEQSYHISLKNVKKEIQTYLFKPAKNSMSTVENLFLFVFDLQDYSTFERLQIYYNQLEKYFQINSNFLKALIGNKVDLKSHFKNEQRKHLDEFIKNNNFKYYEISTFMFFNFELFFENIFKDILSSIDEGFSNPNFLNRFHLLLSKRPNLSKAQRDNFKPSNTPGPGEYKSDVYDYPKDKKVFRQTFSNGRNGRFVTNIFIDKQGPVFPIVNKEVLKNQKEKKKKEEMKNKNQIGFENWDSKKKDARDALETNIPGYSLGIKKGNYNFKQQRKEEAKNRERELENAILENTMTLHIKKEPLFKQNKDFNLYEENKRENLKELVTRIKEKEDEGKDKRKDNLKLLEDLQKQKIKEIQEKQDKYQKKYEEREKELNRTRSGLYHPRSKSSKILKRAQTPVEKLYDVRTKYDPNKGWTFGMKYDINPNKNKDDPDFPHLLSDFDKITSNPKYAEIKYTAPRFKEPIKVKPHTARLRDNYITDEKREKIRKMGERNKILKSFLNDRQRDLERVLENKAMNEQEREQRIEELIRKLPRTGLDNGEYYDYYINDINYAQVEERSPNYTMKGRYQHGSIFDIADNYDAVTNNIDEENLGTNGKPIQDEGYLNNLPVPQYNVVKPTNPSFSFSQANRFTEKPKYQPSPNIEQVEPFKNGEYAPKDQVSWLKTQSYMGTGKRKGQENVSYGPGPGYYKLKGFADIIVEEGAKVSKIRAEIIEKKKREEWEKSGKSYEDFNKEDNKTNIKKPEINDNNDVSIEEIQA